MNFSLSNLFISFLFGAAGIYFVRVGKREANLRALTAGALLLIFPYFVENPWIAVSLGIGLTIFAASALRNS